MFFDKYFTLWVEYFRCGPLGLFGVLCVKINNSLECRGITAGNREAKNKASIVIQKLIQRSFNFPSSHRRSG